MRHVLHEVVEAVALGVAALEEVLCLLFAYFFGVVVEDCFNIALYSAYGGLEFVCYVLCELLFQAELCFALCGVGDGYFEAVVFEAYALYGVGAAVLFYLVGKDGFVGVFWGR